MAVLVHARTFGLIQPAPYEKEQASMEGPLIQAALAWAKRTSRVIDCEAIGGLGG